MMERRVLDKLEARRMVLVGTCWSCGLVSYLEIDDEEKKRKKKEHTIPLPLPPPFPFPQTPPTTAKIPFKTIIPTEVPTKVFNPRISK